MRNDKFKDNVNKAMNNLLNKNISYKDTMKALEKYRIKEFVTEEAKAKEKKDGE